MFLSTAGVHEKKHPDRHIFQVPRPSLPFLAESQGMEQKRNSQDIKKKTAEIFAISAVFDAAAPIGPKPMTLRI